ncbi:MAG: glycosyltransferase 87 family protein [Candidatus Heimdallarchaeota archaeon]|nr:glycosyltransferase 87 family protein [Candidatus Heimdallarchaeota archaeon]
MHTIKNQMGNFLNFNPVFLTNRVIFSTILYLLFHLIISLINLDNIVWLINYESILMISNGTPLYLQETLERDGIIYYLPPAHFPVYFYFMAVFLIIFGPSEFLIRFITWLFVVFTYIILIKLIQPKEEKEIHLINVLYFLNPLLIVTNYFGKFDQFAIFFLFLGLYLASKGRISFAGFILGLGVMVKLLPGVGIIGIIISLYKNKRYKEILTILKSSTSIIIVITSYFYLVYRNSFLSVIKFQVNRLTPNYSLWYYLLSDVSGIYIIIVQFILLILVTYLMINFKKIDEPNSFYLFTALVSATYVLTTRQHYNSYDLYTYYPLIPIIIQSLRSKEYKFIMLIFINFFIYMIGILSCESGCLRSNDVLPTIAWIGVILIFIANSSILYILINQNKNLKHEKLKSLDLLI